MLFFSFCCTLNGYKIFSKTPLIYSSFVRTPTENTILLQSTAAAAIQSHQHKCFTNTYTQSIGVRKTLLHTTRIFFSFFFFLLTTSAPNILKCRCFFIFYFSRRQELIFSPVCFHHSDSSKSCKQTAHSVKN